MLDAPFHCATYPLVPLPVIDPPLLRSVPQWNVCVVRLYKSLLVVWLQSTNDMFSRIVPVDAFAVSGLAAVIPVTLPEFDPEAQLVPFERHTSTLFE